jgi:hypothetical protein
MNRKAELKLEYKEMKHPMGVYLIRNKQDGKIAIGSSRNLRGMLNRLRFEFAMGIHRNKEIQADWNLHGEGQLSFEVLEEWEPKEQLSPAEMAKGLEALEAKWTEKLHSSGERSYVRS